MKELAKEEISKILNHPDTPASTSFEGYVVWDPEKKRYLAIIDRYFETEMRGFGTKAEDAKIFDSYDSAEKEARANSQCSRVKILFDTIDRLYAFDIQDDWS